MRKPKRKLLRDFNFRRLEEQLNENQFAKINFAVQRRFKVTFIGCRIIIETEIIESVLRL